MIHDGTAGLFATCDDCGHDTAGVIVGQTSREAFIAELKAQGWVVRPDEDGTIRTYCSPDCAD